MAASPVKAHEEPAKTKLEWQEDERERKHFATLEISTITIWEQLPDNGTASRKSSLFARYLLDKNGQVIRQEFYGQDDKLKAAAKLEYDKTYRLTEQTSLRSDDSIEDRSVYEYDAKGLLRGYKAFDAKGKLLAKFAYSRDEAKRKIICAKTAPDGKLVYRIEYLYDGALDSAHEVSATRTQHSGGVDAKTENVYDGNGRRIKKRVYGKNGKLSFTWRYEYDSAGRCSNIAKIMPDNSMAIEQRYQFNEHGDEDSVLEYGSDGKLRHRLEYQYEKFN